MGSAPAVSAPQPPPPVEAPLPSAETAAADPIPSEGGSERTFDDWHELLPQLQLKGMAAQLANNAAVTRWDGKRLDLSVASSCSSLLGSVAEEKLQAALQSYLGRPLALRLTVGETDAETPAQRNLREQQVEQAAAEDEFSRDPVVLAAQEAFDAEIVPDSVRRID